MLRRIALLSILFLSVFVPQCHASDIAFSMNVVAQEDSVRVSYRNTGSDPTSKTRVTLELAGKTYDSGPQGTLPPGVSGKVEFKVEFPPVAGSYPLIARLLYDNDGKTVSVINAGYFNYRDKVTPTVTRSISDIVVRGTTSFFVPRQSDYELSLVLPQGVQISNKTESQHGTVFELSNQLQGFSLNSPYYAVYQTKDGVKPHGTAIVAARLTTQDVEKRNSVIPAWLYPLAAFVGLLATALLRKRFPKQEDLLSETQIAALRWTFSVFIVSSLYSIFYFAHILPDTLLAEVGALNLRETSGGRYAILVLETLLKWMYFDGGNYDYFAKYVADPLYAYMLLGNFFVLRWIIKPQPSTDKYWHLMTSVLSLGSLSKKGVFWSKYSKVAVLTLMVKAFYVPMLSSWMINDIFHQGYLTRSFQWEFFSIQRYVVAGLILIDVSVFAFGYLVELPQLKNQIRSVEPTVLGWVVCIMCYPPFNTFTFIPFDKPLHEHWGSPSEFERYLAFTLIALLWGIYCWATIALGPKASNLTNRGTVDSGPYAYIRHPAYVSKVGLWIVSSWFLGEKHFFLIVALVTVYGLRAWTEERHLSQDPDYQAYKKKVPWKMIPRFF